MSKDFRVRKPCCFSATKARFNGSLLTSCNLHTLRLTAGSSNIAVAGKWNLNKDVFPMENGGYSSNRYVSWFTRGVGQNVPKCPLLQCSCSKRMPWKRQGHEAKSWIHQRRVRGTLFWDRFFGGPAGRSMSFLGPKNCSCHGFLLLMVQKSETTTWDG